MATTKSLRYELTAAANLNTDLDEMFPSGVRTFRVYSNRHAHVRISRSEADTVESGMPLPPYTPEILDIPVGNKLWYVLAEGEVSGHIWITRIT